MEEEISGRLVDELNANIDNARISVRSRDIDRWLERLEDELPWVLHRPTTVIGKVKKVHGFNSKFFISPNNGKPVEAPVIEFEDGNTVVAIDPAQFLIMNESHANFSLKFGEVLKTAIEGVASLSRAMCIPGNDALVIMVCLLKRQIRALDVNPGLRGSPP